VSQKSRFAFWLQIANRVKSLSSVIVNSFPDEDCGDSDGYHPADHGQKILHVGPVLLNDDQKKKTSVWQADQTCVDWLDKHSPGSVIYVSFGSWAAPVEPDKITGIARGLEASGRPFLWALMNQPSWRAGLPDGYAEKVAGRGKIVSWAPQDEVLKHQAVGCFVTHCGWNSALEALRHGVRMICYPICGDHFVNSAYVVNMLGAGIALPSSDEGDMKGCVDRVMKSEEGRRLQEKVDELREMIMGEAMCVARRNINLFMEEIKNK
jgi:UDP:flavonoid glycosyltransferase YjiC (YdhE family)